MDRAREVTLFPEYDIYYGKPMVLGSGNTPPKKAQEHNPKSVKCFRVFASAGEFIFKYGFTEAYCLASLAAAKDLGKS